MDPNENNPATTPPANNPPQAATPPANQPTTPTNGGENPPANQPPANSPANQPPATTPPADGGEQKPKGDGEQPTAKDPGDLYDMLKGEDEKNAEAAAKEKADFAAYAKGLGFEGEEIPALDLGKTNDGQELTMPAEDVVSVVRALQHAKIPADQAKQMLATVGALDRIRAERQAEEDNRAIAALQEETRQEFGDNLRQALGDTQAAGLALFGSELWGDIMSIKALTNDKRFIRAMSAYGRSRRNDTGGPAPNAAAAPGGEMSFDMSAFWKGTGAAK